MTGVDPVPCSQVSKSSSRFYSWHGWHRQAKGAGCNVCQKNFLSLATYVSHVATRRHKLKRARSMPAREAGQMATHASVNEPDDCRRDALTMAHVDRKGAILMMWKAGKGYFERGNHTMAVDSFKSALSMVSLELAEEEQRQRKRDDNPCPQDDDDTKCHGVGKKMIDVKAIARRWKTVYEKIKDDISEGDLLCGTEADQGRRKQSVMMKRSMVLNELLDTEKSFVTDLRYITEKVHPLFSLGSTSQILRVNTASIFGNILEIYKFHSRFLKELEGCLPDVTKLGNTFCENEDYFSDIYSRYCQGKPVADDLMDENKEEIEQLFYTYLKGQRLALNDYLIKPVQRLMKYQLLLSLVKKHTSRVGETSDALDAAVQLMKVIPKKANNRMNVAMIVDYPKHISQEELIQQDNLEVSFGRVKHKLRACRVFLFKQCLIVTEIVERQGRMPKYRYLCDGKTAKMGLTTTVHNDKFKFAVWFRKFNSTDIFVCKADSLETKQCWLESIMKLVNSSQVNSKELDPEPTQLQSPSIRRSQTWTATEFVRRATLGHPRERGMSGKLRSNIQRFLTEEYHLTAEETGSGLKVPNGHTSAGHLQRNETFSGIDVQKSTGEITFEGTEDRTETCNDQQSRSEAWKDDESNEVATQTNKMKPCTIVVNGDDHGDGYVDGSRNGSDDNNNNDDRTIDKNIVPTVEYPLLDINGCTTDDEALHALCQRSSEMLLLRAIESESCYLTASCTASQDRQPETWQMYSKALSLFLPYHRLCSISKTFITRSDIVARVAMSYAVLREHPGYIIKTSNYSNVDECVFFSYDGLLRLLRDFSTLAECCGASRFSIVLMTTAIVMATTESHWDDALVLYEQLSRLFEQQHDDTSAVDCLVDAYFISLENGDMAEACQVLANALGMAVRHGDADIVNRTVALAMSLDLSRDPTGTLDGLIAQANDKLSELNCSQ